MIKAKNPTLLKVTYIKPPRKGEVGRPEAFEVIYKDDFGNVQTSYEPANADIYITKPEYRNYNYTKPQERIDHMDKFRVPISKIQNTLLKESGDYGKQLYHQAMSEKNFGKLRQIYKWNYCYGCDFLPEFYYMNDWYKKYTLGTPKLSVAFLDIETDVLDYQPNMDKISDTAHAPVNVVTVIMEDQKEAVTFILRPYEPSREGRSEAQYRERYKLYQQQLKAHEYLMNHKPEFIQDLHKRFDKTYGYLKYYINEYESEVKLIKDVFGYINKRKPNFLLTWNMRFDIQYLYYRLKELGEDPADVMCDPSFADRKCYFKTDTSTYEIPKQYDYFYCTSFVQYICQMRLYGAIRKSQHKQRSLKLNAIANIVLKDKKVEYEDETDMRHFPYMDWIKFIIYNIKDVLLQLGIERKTHDVMTYYIRSHANLTPYNKIFRETHLLRGVREQSFEEQGWIQSNNLNAFGDNRSEQEKRFYGSDEDDDDDEVSYKGAINAEPIWNDFVGMLLRGLRSNNLFKNAMDYDMGAFYPSIKIASNMDPATLLYKASFINDEFIYGQYINRSLNTRYEEKDKYGNIRKLDITGEAVNTYCSGNILTFGYNYHNLPSVTDMFKECDNILGKKVAIA